MNSAFTAVAERRAHDLGTFESIKSELEELIPPGGEPLQVQEQSAYVCLLEAVGLFYNNELESLETIVNAVVDALDNYTFFVRRMVTGETSSPDEFLLLRRELDRQLEDAKFARDYETTSADDILDRRIENFQYAVPVAVG